MTTIKSFKLLSVLILALCLTPSQGQTGCQDVHPICKILGDRGICNTHQAVMFEYCPQTCNVCRRHTTSVVFPSDSIGKPEFVCGLFPGSGPVNRQKRQFDGILQGILGAAGGSKPRRGSNNNRPLSPGSNSNRPLVPGIPNILSTFSHFFQTGNNPLIPSTNVVIPARTSFTILEPSRKPIVPTFSFETTEVMIMTTNYSTATVLPATTPAPLPTPAPIPVGGGSNADIPSVGVVFPVKTSTPSTTRHILVPRPSAVIRPPIAPRPTSVPNPTSVPRPIPILRPTPVIKIINPEPTAIQPTPSSTPTSVENTSSVVVLSTGEDTLEDAICGSVAITDRFLLSAAHCFDPDKRYKVRLGDLDLSDEEERNSMPQTVDIEEVFIHPSYSRSTVVRYNDIALLKTVQQIQFSAFVFPFCVLPKPRDFNGAPLTIAGFGFVNGTHRSPELQATQLEGLNAVRCEKRYTELGYELQLKERYPDLLVGKGVLCASSPGKSACQGDSGGPLTLKDTRGRFYVLGVVSIGASCFANTFSALPGLYTDVAYYVDWIDSVIYGS